MVTCDSERLESIDMIQSGLTLNTGLAFRLFLFLRRWPKNMQTYHFRCLRDREHRWQKRGTLVLSQRGKHFLHICFLLIMQLHDTFWCPCPSCCSNQIGFPCVGITYWLRNMQRLSNTDGTKWPKLASVAPVCFFNLILLIYIFSSCGSQVTPL